jgi:CrcB protein
MTVLLVALGAAVGAPLRYLADRAVTARLGGAHPIGALPLGTFLVNVAGSFVLGAVGSAGSVGALVGTGFCGALTTYSTFSYETVRLASDGRTPLALLNAFGSIVVGVAAAAAGWALVAR